MSELQRGTEKSCIQTLMIAAGLRASGRGRGLFGSRRRVVRTDRRGRSRERRRTRWARRRILESRVPPVGFEPTPPPPEGGALSPELRGRQRVELYQFRGTTRVP